MKGSGNAKTTGDTIKLIREQSPFYLRMRILQHILAGIKPFVPFLFSAWILNALYQGSAKREIVLLVCGAVACHHLLELVIQGIGAWCDTEENQLYWRLHAKLGEVSMRVPFFVLNSPEYEKKLQDILQAAKMYGYGPWAIPGILTSLTEGGMTLITAAVIVAPAVAAVRPEGFGGAVTALLLLLMAGNLVYSVYAEKKLYGMKAVSLQEVAAEYQLSAYSVEYADRSRGAKDIRLYGQQDILKKTMLKMLEIVQKHMSRQSDAQAVSYSVQAVFAEGISLAAYLAVGIQVFRGAFAPGDLVLYVGAAASISGALRRLVHSLQELSMQESYCRAYLDFVSAYEEEEERPHKEQGAEPSKTGEISFENVSFQYPGSDRMALDGISFQLRKGEKVAVVGQNGSGKTTMINLLCRFYEPTAGVIRFRGRDIRELEEAAYRRYLSAVFQDFGLFALPLGENVAASAVCDEDRAARCLKDAGLPRWEESFPLGLAQPLFRKDQAGKDVSGGEAQKIAIARALYKDADFVLMDEPTAALDAKSEAEIYENMARMTEGKGAVYISHRLASCRFCDRILVFKEGRIVQNGTHEELLAESGGEYEVLWNAQASLYQAD